MSNCQNKKYFKLLHAYELGLLDNEQREQLELHLMTCEFCQEELRRLSTAMQTIRQSSDIRQTVGKLSETDKSTNRRPTFIYAIAAIAAVFLFLILKPWDIEFNPTKEAMAENNRLVILNFENLSDKADDKNTGKILSNLLITDLSESQYFHVISSQHLEDIIKFLIKSGASTIDPDMALRVANRAKAKWMLKGSIIQMAPKLIVTVQLIEMSKGDIILSHRMESDSDEDIFSFVDRLSIEVKKNLSLPAEAWNERDRAVADVTTHSPEAYQAYLEGNEFYDKLYYRQANESYRRALEYDSTFAIAYYSLAWSRDPEMMAKALKYSDKATRKEQLYIKSLEARLSGDDELAIKYIRDIIDGYPDEKMAYFELAAYMSKIKNYQEAVRIFHKALEIDPLYKLIYNELIYVYDILDKTDSSFWAAEKYLELAPNEPNPYDSYGELCAKHGRLDKSIEMYEQVHKINPGFIEYKAAITLGRLYVFKQNYSRAKELFQEAVLNGGINNRILARTYLALVSLYQGQFDEAMTILNNGIIADGLDQMRTNTASLIKNMIKANIYLELGNLREAESELNNTDELLQASSDSTNNQIRPFQILLYGQIGNFKMAEKMADYLRPKGDNAIQYPYWSSRGYIEYSKGNFVESIEWLKKPKLVGKIDFLNEFILGRAYLESKRYDDAVKIFENLINNYYDECRLIHAINIVYTHYYLGMAYDKTGKYKKARQQYELFTVIWKNAEPKPDAVKLALDRMEYLRQVENSPIG